VFLGWTAQTRTVCIGAFLIAVAVGLEGWLAALHVTVWAAGMVFPSLFGFVMLHFAQREQVNAKLRLAQAEVEQLARVAERERISRDLHDLLGHTLSVIVLKSELASKLASRDPERAAAEIRDVESVAREALAQVRAAVQGYRSTGLKSEFARAASVLRDAGLEVKSDYTPAELTPLEESVLTLVLREAVTNVIRHARASRCELKVGVTDSSFEMRVADNGVGGQALEGAGLTGMRERVQALGGALERTVEGGTSLLIRLPRAQAQGAA
jgi:two-component system sensor histidine kinase DesK